MAASHLILKAQYEHHCHIYSDLGLSEQRRRLWLPPMARLARDERVHGHLHEVSHLDVVETDGVLAGSVELLRNENFILNE